MGLEMENKFLSSCTDDKKRLSEMLKQIMDDLNSHKMSIVTGNIFKILYLTI